MDSRKFIFIGFLVLTCLGLSSAHRLLLDSYDPRMPPPPPRMPKESISNLPEGSGSRSGAGLPGPVTGGVFGGGGGSGSGWGGGFGCGGPGEGFGGGCCSGSGGGFQCGGCGGPCEGFGGGCCSGSGGGFQCGGCGGPGEGLGGGCCSGSGGGFQCGGPHSECRVQCSCPYSCDGFGVYCNSAAPVQPEFAARMVMNSAGSNIAVDNDPASSNASKEDKEAHQATRGYGSTAFAKYDSEPVPQDSEPVPQDGTDPERNQEDQKMMDGNTMAVDDTMT